MINVLHITAHLGGGVGKVLSRVVEESHRRRNGIRHTIACLEKPEKCQFAEHVRSHGGELLVCPSPSRIDKEIAVADIVQLEWWHHPVVAGWLCSGILAEMRLMVWSHVSGLHPPEIPAQFVAEPHRFLFTSPCSWEHPALAHLRKGKTVDNVVFSSGGFDDLPTPQPRRYGRTLRAGYVGTLNFAKLHPSFPDFLAAIAVPDFKVALVGDPTTANELIMQAKAQAIDGSLEIRGYSDNVAKELAGFDILPYLLNPLHYGTTENALLEAMAMGVIPIVLDNPAERCIVRDGETGLVVNSPHSFAEAVRYLTNNHETLRNMSNNASSDIRRRFTITSTVDSLDMHYRDVILEPKRTFDFRPLFGAEPADWFRVCMGSESWRFNDSTVASIRDTGNSPAPHFLFEKTKGSVFHYSNTYPDDNRLKRWARQQEVSR
jgi:glycosyltransferase involved in cell wall biosynthesis